jgi:hypothetical protein
MRARIEHFLARRANVWYYAALAVALTINFIVFFQGQAHGPSSLSCDSGDSCDSRFVFNWITQSWGASSDSHAFGLRLPGRYAVAVRVLALVHWSLAVAMFIGWLAVPGRVLISQLRSKGSVRERVEVDASAYQSEVVLERRQTARVWSVPMLYLKLMVSPQFMAHLGYVLVSTLGITVSPMFYVLELFALAYRVVIFNEVISAIVSNPTRLLSTIVLFVIGMWTFVLVGAAFFYNKYKLNDPSDEWSDVCADFSSCFGYATRMHFFV